jgi:branched-chain amino acid transport system permease protein
VTEVVHPEVGHPELANGTAKPAAGGSRGSSPWFAGRSLANLPAILGPSFSAIAVGAACLIALFILNGNYDDSILLLALSYAIVVLGMTVQVGYSHQLAFSQSVFMGLGAYGVAVLNTKYAWPIAGATVVVVLVAVVIGLVIGAAVTRVPGFALALATLFFSVIVAGYVTFNVYLGASTGLGGIASLWNGSTFTSTLERSGVVAIVLLCAVFFICARILKSGIGLELALLGSDERVAASIGVNTGRRKLELFVLGSAIAALGGAVFAGTQNFVSTGSFDQTAELTLLIMLFIGGRRSLFGALIGAIGIEYLSGTSNWVASYLLIVEGVVFTLILLFAPEGAIDLVRRGGAGVVRIVRRVFSSSKSTGRAEAVGSYGQAGTFGAEDSVDVVGVDAGYRPNLSTDSAIPSATIDSDTLMLECKGLTKSFGGVVAVDAVTLQVRGTGIHAICGPNGAGKSTLFELISGGYIADAGEVFIEGRNVSKLPPYQRARLGMARTLQSVRLMNQRSVLDNVAIAALKSHRTNMLRAIFKSEWREAHERAFEALSWVGIAHMAPLRPGNITLEAQRMVELARALVASPRLLLLDEPASGLSTEQRARLAATLVSLSEHMTIILVEHDLQMVARIASEVFVLIDGRLEFQGSGEEFLQSSVVRAELMGLLADEEEISFTVLAAPASIATDD